MDLEVVHEEDRPIVKNVAAAIEALKVDRIFTSWTVVIGNGGYVLNAYIADSADCELSSRELDIIHSVSPLRVISAAMARQSGKLMLRVRITDRNEPIMLTEVTISHVRKRSRWLL